MKFMAMRFVIAVWLLAGCSTDPFGPGGDYYVDFDTEPGSLTVKNNIEEDLVLFAGPVSPDNMLGGVRANSAREFSLEQVIRGAGGAVLLRGVTYAGFKENPATISDEDAVYYRLVPGQGKATVNIDGKMRQNKGDYLLGFSNQSNFLLEVRRDSPKGPVVTVLPPFYSSTKIVYFESPAPINFFLLYYAYDSAENQIIVSSLKAGWSGMATRASPEKEGQPYPRINFTGLESKLNGLILLNES